MISLRSFQKLSRRLSSTQAPNRGILAGTFEPRPATGIDKLRDEAKQTSISREFYYGPQKHLSIKTIDREHIFQIKSHNLVRYAKLGLLNQRLAIHYCHYLAHLARSSSEDEEYYAKNCLDVMESIVVQYQDIIQQTKRSLLCEVANTTPENCLHIHSKYLTDDIVPTLTTENFKDLLSAYYRFQLYGELESTMRRANSNQLFRHYIVDEFVQCVVSASKAYIDLNESSRNELIHNLIRHIQFVFGKLVEHRVLFLTEKKKDLVEALRTLGFRVTEDSTIKKDGRCKTCNFTLPQLGAEVTKKINQSLHALMEQGSEKGLLLHVTPGYNEKFLSFLKFISANDERPFDCVIDGPNVAYKSRKDFVKELDLTTNTRKVKNLKNGGESTAQRLINTIIKNKLLSKYDKILIIMQQHMRRWPELQEFLDNHKGQIYYFCTDTKTKDDIFQLYASTLSNHTVLVSTDYFRDHLARLDHEYRTLMERWLDTHQVWVNLNMDLTYPMPHDILPSCNEKEQVFHIPIIDNRVLFQESQKHKPIHVNPNCISWICCSYGSTCKNKLE